MLLQGLEPDEGKLSRPVLRGREVPKGPPATRLNQMAAALDQPLLQAGQRPAVDPCWQRQPPPQVAQVVGDQTEPQPHLIGPEAVAGKPRHRNRLLTFFDPVPFQGVRLALVLS